MEEAIASGGLLPEHLMSAGMKRPRLPEPAGRDRAGGRGGRGRGRGGRGVHGAPARAAQLQLQLPARPPLQTEPRRDVQSTADNAESGSDSDNDAPEVLSAKRPPHVEAHESSSSDVEPEKHQIATAAVDSPSLIAAGGAGVTTAAASPAHPPTVLNASARPTDVTRKAPPPQPKKPLLNPFAARTSLLRSVSEHICFRL